MRRISIYSVVTLIAVLFSMSMLSCSEDKGDMFSEKVKVSLRDVGHQLLLSNQDSTSLVLPVVSLEASKYQLSFQNQLFFEPSYLVSTVQKSFQNAHLSKNYLVEVIQCTDNEVAYSYEMMDTEDKSIIPCRGRVLPIKCYIIEVQFLNKTISFFNEKAVLLLLFFTCLGFLSLWKYRRKGAALTKDIEGHYTSLGSFQFFPEQNKLVKEALEISLSKKECELLEIFVANPNQIIKREELMKKVWEDNGVFVGRSLDTYISKLRKKLKDDTSIKLTNVHGVGYKLEIDY